MSTHLQIKAMDALVHLHKVIKNAQLYPSTSPAVISSLENLYQHLLDILRQEAPLVFAESERKATLGGKLLNQKDQETIHVTSLLDILFNYGIKSISFDTGLEKEELNIFISILTKKPEVVYDEGGLRWLMAENKIAHIYLDNKIYVILDKDRKSFSQIDMTEEGIYESVAEMENAVNRHIENIFNENVSMRIQAVNELARIIESLPYDKQIDMIKRLSGQLVEWIKLETSLMPAYKKICKSLQKLLQDFISRGLLADALPVMDVFSKINTGKLKKDNNIREEASEVLRNLASEDNINMLLKELNTNENNNYYAANQILAGFGNMILSKLLDIVRDAKDSKERVRMIHLIEEMGDQAIPAIKDRINIDAPWYFSRNLAYMLGHIGNENSAYMLQPLLLHKHNKVRVEAFKSICQTGKNQRGPLLLSVLPQAEGQLKLDIIEMLGKIKYAEAATHLLDMLKTKSLLVTDELTILQEKICTALGAIGSPEAIPTLSEIAGTKSLFSLKSYPDKVKYAAKRALESIKRK